MSVLNKLDAISDHFIRIRALANVHELEELHGALLKINMILVAMYRKEM